MDQFNEHYARVCKKNHIINESRTKIIVHEYKCDFCLFEDMLGKRLFLLEKRRDESQVGGQFIWILIEEQIMVHNASF